MARNTSELVYRSEGIKTAATVETIGGTRVRNIWNTLRYRTAVHEMNQATLARIPDHAFDADQFIPRSI